MRSVSLLLAIPFAVALLGCTSRSTVPVHLNDPTRSLNARDVGSFTEREVPYEMQERDGLRVAYHLTFVPTGSTKGYRLTLMFQNIGTEDRQIAPVVTLQDGTGFLISSASYESTMALGASLAGTPAPGLPAEQRGFSSGFARSAAMASVRDRSEGREIMQWANAFWLKSSYRLPAGGGAGGSLLFPASKIGPLPLRLTVEIGRVRFMFVTSTAQP